ncbi:uncharacterized protein LOC125505062 [Dendroctonus ponderosae]|uniref:CHK kinase-like domain-containing protein n=1 Tax=Dendroctonus ponderosae TaxID=77166 RepID=U4TRU6_DENPD|nr:uncharacterized protein LOC125505062 [Dendroctonus ponderosae]ERL84199.1 hypothetical protein D910_01576 [Dendroctonus ponderosae]KAH0998491.1 hypothetical protein HUJ05_000015 [Dendroctonus ponderosae]
MLSQEQESLLNEVCAQDGFKDFTFSVEEGCKKGDNFLGNVRIINVKENGMSKEKSYVLKCAETDLRVRSQIPVHSLYERERFVYETLLPTFEIFQQSRALKYPFKSYTKLRGCSVKDGDECLLMNNIKDAKFQMLDRKNGMDADHVSHVFRELAKFHSVSLAMKHLLPETYQSLTSNLEDVWQEMPETQGSYLRSTEKAFDHALKIVEGHEKATKALEKCQIELNNIFSATAMESNKLVVTHGDSWCNNMMFKYEDPGNLCTPTSMCFLDWQICKISSPAMDLFYFLFLSGSKFALDNHQTFLDEYYETVQKNLQHLGLDTNEIFPYELFQQHCKQNSAACMCIAMCLLHHVLMHENHATNFVELANDGLIFEKFMNQETYSDEYNSRVRDIICMMVDHEYI